MLAGLEAGRLEGWQAERLKGSNGISLTENVLVSFKGTVA
jgi:hypothetical protein